jgi:diaminopimelate decarboxylase/aspartate kinase
MSDESPWWEGERARLLQIGGAHLSAYVYHTPSIQRRCRELKGLNSVSRVWYAMKANSHPLVLQTAVEEGLDLECVSLPELRLAQSVPGITPKRILFTPNFAPRAEYQAALEAGVVLTLDGLYPLREWTDLFRGAEIILRFNPERPRGHHRHVETAGPRAKFGIPLSEADEAAELVRAAGATVVGLHAHAGSGVDDPTHWGELARVLAEIAPHFPEATVFNLGGGLGVPRQRGDHRIDFAALDAALAAFHADFPDYTLWLEPGRYVIAEAGVLLAQVTQVKYAHGQRFIGVATGMNSLIRPALYDARHEIFNLTRLDEEPEGLASVVGPICESADALGVDRMLPKAEEGDVMLIATGGAYGHVMASRYNLREPAEEFVLD